MLGWADRQCTSQVPWKALLQGSKTPEQHSEADCASDAALPCSLAWLPDGLALAVMDTQGTAALLDVHGTQHALQPAARASQEPQQVRTSSCELGQQCMHAQSLHLHICLKSAAMQQ